MAKWAKHLTRCRICGKKIDKNRLICEGANSDLSIWFRELCNIKVGDYRSRHSNTVRDHLHYLDSKNWVWYDDDYKVLLKNRRNACLLFFKESYNLDIEHCPPIYKENSLCLAQLRNWAKERNLFNYEVTNGLTSPELAVLVDEYLMSH